MRYVIFANLFLPAVLLLGLAGDTFVTTSGYTKHLRDNPYTRDTIVMLSFGLVYLVTAICLLKLKRRMLRATMVVSSVLLCIAGGTLILAMLGRHNNSDGIPNAVLMLICAICLFNAVYALARALWPKE